MEQVNAPNDVANDVHLNPTPAEIVLNIREYQKDHEVMLGFEELGRTTRMSRVFTHWEAQRGRTETFDELRFDNRRCIYNARSQEGNALEQAKRFLNSHLDGPVREHPTKLIMVVWPLSPNMFQHRFFERELIVLQSTQYEHLYTLLDRFNRSSKLTIGCPKVLANKYLGTLAFQPPVPEDFFENPVVQSFSDVTVLVKNKMQRAFTNNRIMKLHLEKSELMIHDVRRKIELWLQSDQYIATEWSVTLQPPLHSTRWNILGVMMFVPSEIQNNQGRIHTYIVRRASDGRTATVTVGTYTKKVTFTLNA